MTRMFDHHLQAYVDTDVPTYAPAPTPAGITEMAERMTAITNQIPPGWWAAYGDIGKAYEALYGTIGGGLAPQGVASTLSYMPKTTTEWAQQFTLQERVAEWCVPWHRVRLATGIIMSREHGEHLNPYDVANAMLKVEGVKFYDGIAPQSSRLDIAAVVNGLTPHK